MALTASNTVKLLKTIISDYNYWGESESDSPLAIKRIKGLLNDTKMYQLDGVERKKREQTANPDYTPPPRKFREESIHTVFTRLIVNALNEVQELDSEAIETQELEIETLLMPVEALEYYVQLYSAFKQLDSTRVCYIEDDNDGQDDPYTGLFISGRTSDNQTVYAQAMLIQT